MYINLCPIKLSLWSEADQSEQSGLFKSLLLVLKCEYWSGSVLFDRTLIINPLSFVVMCQADVKKRKAELKVIFIAE